MEGRMKYDIGKLGESRMIGISFNKQLGYYSISFYVWKYEFIILLKKVKVNYPENCSFRYEQDKRWHNLGCNNTDKHCKEPCEFNKDIPRECISHPDDMANFIKNKYKR
jgi:hypothetical protein